MNDSPTRDSKALTLRLDGRSFAAIATELGFSRALEANDAFNRALRRRPRTEQRRIRDGELVRLEALAKRERDRVDADGDDAKRRLRAIGKLRDRLLAP